MPDRSTLGRTLETLTDPLAGGPADGWRDRVNCRLRQWTGSDAVLFRVSDGSPTRVNPLTPQLLEARDAYRRGGFRSLDPWATPRMGGDGTAVGTFEDLLGPVRFHASSYFRHFLRPRGITDHVGIQVVGPGSVFATLAVFNLGASKGEEYVADVLRRVRAVVPALQAGFSAWLEVRPGFTELGAMVDEVSEPLLLCDEEGGTVHANSALARLLAGEPEAERLREALSAAARLLAAAPASPETSDIPGTPGTAGAPGGDHGLVGLAEERTVRTSVAVYRVRRVRRPELLRGEREEGVVLGVGVEPLRGGPPPERWEASPGYDA